MILKRRIVLALGLLFAVSLGVYAGRTGHAATGSQTPQAAIAQVTQSAIGEVTQTAMERCIQSGQHICNPQAWETAVAGNVLLQPPSPNAHLVSEEQAIAVARAAGRSGATPPAPATAVVHAKLMTRRAYEKLYGFKTADNQDRMVWVVTVHADRLFDRTRTEMVHAYTVAVDAATGAGTDIGPQALLG